MSANETYQVKLVSVTVWKPEMIDAATFVRLHALTAGQWPVAMRALLDLNPQACWRDDDEGQVPIGSRSPWNANGRVTDDPSKDILFLRQDKDEGSCHLIGAPDGPPLLMWWGCDKTEACQASSCLSVEQYLAGKAGIAPIGAIIDLYRRKNQVTEMDF